MEERRPETLLTIAGFDPGGGAGITADLEVFARYGRGAAVITVVTCQNPDGVAGTYVLPQQALEGQFAAVAGYYDIRGVKIGLLGDAPQISRLASLLSGLGDVPIVLDPVSMSSSGYRFMTDEARDAVLNLLVPLAAAVTPNLPELAFLAGLPATSCEGEVAAARELIRRGAAGVVVTGGHREGPPDDLVVTPRDVVTIPGRRTPGFPAHGGGCRHSSALTVYLAGGVSLPEAARRAKAFMEGTA